jgi:ribonuclease HII
MTPVVRPTLETERRLWRAGHQWVAGVDEVGRGAWAGPLSVGVAVVHAGIRTRSIPAWLRDSKALAEERREHIFAKVANWCADAAVGHATPEECDRYGMTLAWRLAAYRALATLEVRPDAIVIDGPWDLLRGPRLKGGDAADGTSAPAPAMSQPELDLRPGPVRGSAPAPSAAAAFAAEAVAGMRALGGDLGEDMLEADAMDALAMDALAMDEAGVDGAAVDALAMDAAARAANGGRVGGVPPARDSNPPLPAVTLPETVLPKVRADATCAAVAAASVLAKVVRDRWMREESEHFPAYGFERNKGYPSTRHQIALRGYGLSAIHRRSWAFVADLPWR